MKSKIILIIISILIVQFALGQEQIGKWSEGKIFVKFNKNVNLTFDENGEFNVKEFPFINELSSKYEFTKIKFSFAETKSEKLKRTIKIEFLKTEGIDLLIKELLQQPEIEYAEKIPNFTKFAVPNDPLYNQIITDAHYNIMGFLTGDLPEANTSWHLNKINAEQAWELQSGDPNIVVAVLDNGIWTDHPDLQNVVVHKYDIADNDTNTTPPTNTYEWSHGTHTAGLIGAETNNGIGVASIGNGISVMAIKIQENSTEDMSSGIEAMAYAADNGAKIISMSWGGEETTTTEANAANYAYELGCVLLASAGNNGDGSMNMIGMTTNGIMYPAAYNCVVAVGASDYNDAKSTFSQYGTWVDILSPGGYGNNGFSLSIPIPGMEGIALGQFSVLSTTYSTAGPIDLLGASGGASDYNISGNYDIMPGTSMSCPIAAGLCGLIWSANQNLTNEQVINILKTTCTNVDAQNSEFIGQIGAGRIDAYAAICAAQGIINTPQFENKFISVYPNPTNNFVNITNCKNTTYEILDILGKVIKKGTILEDFTTINITDLQTGNYVLKIKKQENSTNIKLIKI
ncbi:MAG: S8 family peptidase [Bacteroidales bacterium]|jgi:hypothetical protein|nr:S8 family peptidase [Bacteroidales bacterium]